MEAYKQRVAYNAYPIRAVHELGELLDAMRKELPRIDYPVGLIHSRQDGFIPPEHMQLLHDHIGSTQKEMHWVENSSHVITCDASRTQVFQIAQEFADNISTS
jgi:carboxylesterase